MTDTVDPRVAREQERVKRAEERLAKAKRREKQIAEEAELEKRRAELTRGISAAVKKVVTDLGLPVPAEGMTIFVHPGENGLGVDAAFGRKRGSNDNRRTISDLGHSGFILPDGSKVGSAAKVLDAFGHPHKNDSAARLILTWAKDNPDKAKGVQVIIGKEKITLVEAVKRI